MKKSELRQMIREMLREELNKVDTVSLLHEEFEVTAADALKFYERAIDLRKKESETDDNDPFDNIFDGETTPDFDKRLALARTIFRSPNFKFTTASELHTLQKEGSALVSSRVVTDAIDATNGDKQKFLAWVDKSKFSAEDKKMFHDILK